ncbi:MAG: hypothetical protein ACJAZP_000542 [Psychromonas sp.]
MLTGEALPVTLFFRRYALSLVINPSADLYSRGLGILLSNILELLMKKIIGVVVMGLFVLGCTPEVGTEEWCTYVEKQPKGDLTANEVRDYAKFCLF